MTAAVPSATRSGTSTSSITTTESDAPVPAFGAWRELSAITSSSTCAGPNQYRVGPGLTETIVASPF